MQQWGQDLPRQNLQTSYKIYAIKLPLFLFVVMEIESGLLFCFTRIPE